MAGLGQAASQNRDMFAQRRSDVEAFHQKMVDLCDNETKLKAKVQAVVALLQARVTSMSIDTRERLRDAIRSEGFAKSFNSDLQAARLTL
jgi:hypothetical protein